MREHGTHACFVWGPEPGSIPGRGCRCEACRRANRDYERERRGRTAPAYVDAEPARRHVRDLMGRGVGLKQITRLTGVSGGVLCKLLYGGPGDRPPSRRIRRATEDRLLAVTPADVADGARVDAGPTWANVATLLDRGWTKAAIARAIGQTSGGLQLSWTKVTAGNARTIAALLDEPVPPRRSRHGLHEVAQPEADPDAELAEVVKARTEVDTLPIIDPAVFDAEWRRRAACRHVPEAERWIFWAAPTDTEATRAALDVCATCPVVADCLDYAMEAGEEGVWGATTDAERAYLAAVPDPDDRWIHERWVALGHCPAVMADGRWCENPPHGRTVAHSVAGHRTHARPAYDHLGAAA